MPRRDVHSREKRPTILESYLNVPDSGLHYPVYSGKCLRSFQSPENGEMKDQSSEEEVVKTYKIKDKEILHAAYTLQERNMQLLRNFK